MPKPKSPSGQAAAGPTATCARCGAVRSRPHMLRLKSGRHLCQKCVSVLRGKHERAAEETGAVPRAKVPPRGPPVSATPETGRADADQAPPNEINNIEDLSDPDLGTVILPADRDLYDAAEVDTMPCPKCGETVVFGVPTCDSCGVILDDYWSEEDVIHPLSPGERRRRYLRRAAVFAGLVLTAYVLWPTKPEQTRWESILHTILPGPGVGLDEESRGAQIHPSIQRIGRRLVVRNDDSFNWSDVEIKLNAKTGGLEGYAYRVPLLPAGQHMDVTLRSFQQTDGAEFTPEGVPITRVDIRCLTPDGLALWNIPEFVDATKRTTVD